MLRKKRFVDENLVEINDPSCAERFKKSLLRFYDGERVLFFSNYVNLNYRSIEVKIKDLNYETLKKYHYMSITFDKVYEHEEKIKNSYAVLIDVDANSQAKRDEVIKYAKERYSKRIISITTKSPLPINQKHKYGCHILIYKAPEEDYFDIKKEFVEKFDCIDRMNTFYCVKNPLYMFFQLEIV